MKTPKTKSKKKTRQYSRAFTPKNRENVGRYLLDDVPAGLWRDVKAKLKREGKSLRALLLEYLATWVDVSPAGLVPAGELAPASVIASVSLPTSESPAPADEVPAAMDVPAGVVPPVPCAKCGGTGITPEAQVCGACQGTGVVPAVP